MSQKKWGEGEKKLLNRLNKVSVEKDELWELAGEIEARHESGDAEPGDGMFAVAQLYSSNPHKAQAVWFRMFALSNLIEKEPIPGWTLQRQLDGSIPTNAAVLTAAALEPLIRVGNDIGFDRNTFLGSVWKRFWTV